MLSYEDHQEITKSYEKVIKENPLLTAIEEKKLFLTLKNGNKKSKEKAREKLILSNLKLALKISIKLYSKFGRDPDVKMTVMDFIEEGHSALIEAVDHYDVNSGNRFNTYAIPTINNRVIKAMDKTRFIRLPTNHFLYHGKIEYNMAKDHGNVNLKKIAKTLHITERYLDIILSSKRSNVESIDKVDIGDYNDEDGDKISFAELLDSESPSPLDLLMTEDIKKYLLDKLSELKPRQKEIIILKFFSDDEIILRELEKMYGVTYEAIRLDYFKGLRQLRKIINRDLNNKKNKENIL